MYVFWDIFTSCEGGFLLLWVTFHRKKATTEVPDLGEIA